MLVRWEDVALLGIDVGFSARRKTTGIATYRFGQKLRLHCVGSLAEHRTEALRDGDVYDAIAIDGPIVSNYAITARHCERVLSRGVLGLRCKAGFSHFGTGLKLRHAATVIACEMSSRRRMARAPVVEAFPNAFLGVMLDDAAYHRLGTPIPRGKKSDLFFEQAVVEGRFEALFACLEWRDSLLLDEIKHLATTPTRAAHEHRAALVCVVTAACALSGKAEYIGDVAGGFICLPPKVLWADWAVRALEAQQAI